MRSQKWMRVLIWLKTYFHPIQMLFTTRFTVVGVKTAAFKAFWNGIKFRTRIQEFLPRHWLWIRKNQKMRFAPQGIERITAWKLLIGEIPLVAIGGIKLEQAEMIFAAGANSVAVVSDVTQNADPDARVRAWLTDYSEAV